MGVSSFAIIFMKLKLEWHSIIFSSLGAIVGIIFGQFPTSWLNYPILLFLSAAEGQRPRNYLSCSCCCCSWIFHLSRPYQLPPPCYPFIFPSLSHFSLPLSLLHPLSHSSLGLSLTHSHLSITLSKIISIYHHINHYLSITISIIIYLSPYLSIYLSIYHTLCLSIYLSIYLSLFLSVNLSIDTLSLRYRSCLNRGIWTPSLTGHQSFKCHSYLLSVSQFSDQYFKHFSWRKYRKFRFPQAETRK